MRDWQDFKKKIMMISLRFAKACLIAQYAEYTARGRLLQPPPRFITCKLIIIFFLKSCQSFVND